MTIWFYSIVYVAAQDASEIHCFDSKHPTAILLTNLLRSVRWEKNTLGPPDFLPSLKYHFIVVRGCSNMKQSSNLLLLSESQVLLLLFVIYTVKSKNFVRLNYLKFHESGLQFIKLFPHTESM